LKTYLQKQAAANTITLTYTSNYSHNTEVFDLDISTLKYETHTSNNTEVTSSQIKKITNAIQNSREKIVKELALSFANYLTEFTKFDIPLQAIIHYTNIVDVIQCKCYIAHKYNYCKPVIEKKVTAFLSFTGIRHPLIEFLQTNELYVTNDLALASEKDPYGILLYGTNAVGKTSFIKSIGIALIMAQAGLYVPCQSFIYSPYNYIFTRILGNDNLLKAYLLSL
jgi:DNA mismatch repair protein MutS